MSVPPDFTDSHKESAQSPPGSPLEGATQMPYPLNQVVEIPIDHILVNPKQPRRSIKNDSIQELAASMKVKGQTTPVRTRPLTEEERAAHPGQWVMHIGGHRRRAAAILNQFKTLKCIVEDIPPHETHHEAVLDNLHKEMDWWDWDVLIAIEHEDNPNMNQRDLADWVGVSLGAINNALKIARAFNVAALGLVDENIQKTLKKDVQPLNTKNKGFLITESILLVLADLEDPDLVLKALQVVLDDYLTETETDHFVQWLKAGNRVEDYSAKKVAEYLKTLKTHTAQGAGSPTEPAHPNRGSGLDDQTQGAGSPTEPAHPNRGSGLDDQTQGAGSPTEPAHPNRGSGLDDQTQGAESPTKPAHPVAEAVGHATGQEPEPQEADTPSGFRENLKQVFEGFSTAGIKDLLGKIPDNKWQALGYVFEKIIWGGIKRLGKFLFWLIKAIGHHLTKGIHSLSKSLATMLMPLGRSGASGSHGGSRSHSTGSGLSPLRFLGHWALYGLITVFCYSFLLGTFGNFIPGIGPWVRGVVMALVHFLVHLPLWVLGEAVHQPLILLALFAVLYGILFKIFRPNLWSGLFLAVVLLAAWWFRGWWMPYLPTANLLPTQSSGDAGKIPVVVSDTTQPTPNPIPPQSCGTTKKATMVAKKLSHIHKVVAPAVSQPPTSNSHASGSTPNHALRLSKGSSLITPNFSLKPWSPSEEDQASFDAELSALSKPCEIMPFPVDPDAVINADMAPRVLGDLADPDKYTVYRGA